MYPLPVETYVMLSKLTQAELVQALLVDDEGNKLLTGDDVLPSPFLMPVATRIWQHLGKLPEKSTEIKWGP